MKNLLRLLFLLPSVSCISLKTAFSCLFQVMNQDIKLSAT